MKYHLGCGSRYMDGYVNVDFPSENHTVNQTVKADLYTDILTMEYEPCDEIRSHHFFEHFGYVDAFRLLENWTVALKEGGTLLIDVPDLNALSMALVGGTLAQKFRVIRYLYGSQEAPWARHINGWTEETLYAVLNVLGYGLSSVKRYGNPTDECPNCGVSVSAPLNVKMDREHVHSVLEKCLDLYTNGDTDFERRLADLWRSQL